MKTLLDHVKILSKKCHYAEDQVLRSILRNDFIIDDDSLLCYSINKGEVGEIMMMWGEGDGEKIIRWAKSLAKENDCEKLCCISNRWEALCRKFKFRPTGVLCEMEVCN